MKRDHRVKWTGGLQFLGTGGGGQSVVIDSDKQAGVSPMEMLLLAAGGCASVDLITILQKARQQVVDAWVDIGGVRREAFPRIYTKIEMHFVVKGVGVQEHHVKRAIDLAMKKYCSASAHLAALADIRTSYEIIEADTP